MDHKEKENTRYPRLIVPYIDQSRQWPTGCESVSAVMLLQFLNIPISVDRFILHYLPMQEMKNIKGVLYGPDPSEYFAGSPYNDASFGCYPPVMVKALNACFKNCNAPYEAYDATGISTEELRLSLIRGFPVLYWTGIDLKETISGPSWKVIMKDGREKNFTWRSNEHCMLLTGISEDKMIFNDPWQGHGIIAYDTELTQKRHRELYEMAVCIKPV